MTKKRPTKYKVKRPSIILYVILGGLLSLYAAIFKKHKVASELPKGLKPPFIIVCNHTSFFDFVYSARAFYPKRVNFVVARKYFHFPGLHWVLKMAHAIPKSLYQADISTITSMFDIIKQGGIVGLYPEGQISIHGITIDIGEAIAKFIKKSGVPVVSLLTGGAYFTNPPWSKTSRKGTIESHIKLVLTKEQTKELSEDEIKDIIQQSIYIDNYEWQQARGYFYKGKNLAEGLENVLYRCPCCRKEYTITTEGNLIVCENCGIKAGFHEDGHLHWEYEKHFRHLGEWHTWQLEQEKMVVASDDKFTITEPVELAMLKTKGTGVEIVGKGLFTANRSAYIYTGTLHGQEVTLSYHTVGIRYLPFDTGRNFQIYDKNLLYEFRPANPKWCMKIANICECLYESNKNKDLRNKSSDYIKEINNGI